MTPVKQNKKKYLVVKMEKKTFGGKRTFQNSDKETSQSLLYFKLKNQTICYKSESGSFLKNFL